MPIPHSHVSNRKSPRTFSGEKEARDIVGWLNFRQHPDYERVYEQLAGKGSLYREQRRVAEILRLYEQSRIEWEDLKQHGIDSRPRSSAKKKKSASLELDRRLRRYTFYPQFFPLG